MEQIRQMRIGGNSTTAKKNNYMYTRKTETQREIKQKENEKR